MSVPPSRRQTDQLSGAIDDAYHEQHRSTKPCTPESRELADAYVASQVVLGQLRSEPVRGYRHTGAVE